MPASATPSTKFALPPAASVTVLADSVVLFRAGAPICDADESVRETPGYPYRVHELPPMFDRTIVSYTVPAAPSLVPTDALRPVVEHATAPPAAAGELDVPGAAVLVEVPADGDAAALADVPVDDGDDAGTELELELDEEQPVAAIAATASAEPVIDVRRTAFAVKFMKILSLNP